MNKANMKPADELAWIRQQISELKAREEHLRSRFIDGTLPTDGDEYWIQVERRTQNRLSRDLIEEHYGSLEPFYAPVDTTFVRVRKLPT